MAYQVGSACYSEAQDAVAAIASSQVGAVVAHGGAAYVVNVTALDAASITYSLAPIAGGAAITLAASVNPQPCGLMTGTDGALLGLVDCSRVARNGRDHVLASRGTYVTPEFIAMFVAPLGIAWIIVRML